MRIRSANLDTYVNRCTRQSPGFPAAQLDKLRYFAIAHVPLELPRIPQHPQNSNRAAIGYLKGLWYTHDTLPLILRELTCEHMAYAEDSVSIGRYVALANTAVFLRVRFGMAPSAW